MAEVFFYHLQQRTLDQALPELLEKTLARGWRAVVLASSAERVEALNARLWTYSRDGFLPHGSAGDGRPAAQPIWLTAQPENPNDAQVLFLVDGAETDSFESFSRICDLFDGNDETALASARSRWARAKAGGHSLTYWQQSQGRWEKKAEA